MHLAIVDSTIRQHSYSAVFYTPLHSRITSHIHTHRSTGAGAGVLETENYSLLSNQLHLKGFIQELANNEYLIHGTIKTKTDIPSRFIPLQQNIRKKKKKNL